MYEPDFEQIVFFQILHFVILYGCQKKELHSSNLPPKTAVLRDNFYADQPAIFSAIKDNVSLPEQLK